MVKLVSIGEARSRFASLTLKAEHGIFLASVGHFLAAVHWLWRANMESNVNEKDWWQWCSRLKRSLEAPFLS